MNVRFILDCYFINGLGDRFFVKYYLIKLGIIKEFYLNIWIESTLFFVFILENSSL